MARSTIPAHWHVQGRPAYRSSAPLPPPLPPVLQEEQLRLYGLPIRPSFSRKYPPKRSLRRSLGMDLDKPAVRGP